MAALVSSLAWARPESANQAQAVARRLEARYHSAATLKATFLERYSEGRHDVRLESGTVYFSRPGRMRWEYEAPEQKLFIADGKTVWFYVPADRTVSRAQMKESSDWRTPLALLTGKAKLSRFCGRVELAREPALLAGVPSNHVLLRCIPRGYKKADPDANSQRGSFREALLEVDPATGELARVFIRETGGVEIEYRFASWQQNLPVAEAMFHFHAPAGVAIVDESSVQGVVHELH